MSLILHAPNVHQGGGSVLLLALLRALDRRHAYCAQLDARLTAAESARATAVYRVEPSVRSRLAAEFRLRSLAQSGDRVLCFGNLPPLFRLRGRVFLYLQNRYLTGVVPTAGFAAGTRIRLAVESLWLRWRLGTADTVLVQSPSMREEVEERLGRQARVMPFVPGTVPARRRTTTLDTRRAAFLYVASGEPHKNHERLIEAWRLLAAEGLRPTLLLTLDPAQFPALVELTEQAKREHGVDIRNAGAVSSERLAQLYREADALIYPSTLESFGLPLIEARDAGLPIVAAECDFVRDVVDPVQSFDPGSSRSMARAVQRFLGAQPVRQSAPDAEEFIRQLLELDL